MLRIHGHGQPCNHGGGGNGGPDTISDKFPAVHKIKNFYPLKNEF
jgi:hypothetical protein